VKLSDVAAGRQMSIISGLAKNVVPTAKLSISTLHAPWTSSKENKNPKKNLRKTEMKKIVKKS